MTASWVPPLSHRTAEAVSLLQFYPAVVFGGDVSGKAEESADVTDKSIPTASSEDGSSIVDRAIVELEKGNYHAAISLIEREYKSEKDPDEAISMAAWFYYMAYEKGWDEGFSRLKQLVTDKPTFAPAHMWISVAYLRSGQGTKAIEHTKLYRDLAITDQGRVEGTIRLARQLLAIGEPDKAFTELKSAFRYAQDPPLQSSLFEALGDVLIKTRKDEPFFAIACYEKALRLQPANTKLRFNLAYDHSSILTHEEVFYHYRKHLKTNNDSAALNNAGVEAKSLKLLISSIDYYMAAADEGSTLAMANMAKMLMQAGFSSQARDLLEKARKLPDCDPTVDMVLGTLQERKTEEGKAIEEIETKVKQLVSWRWNEAEAIAQAQLNPLELIGLYSQDDGALLTLKCGHDLSLHGELNDGKSFLTLTGSLEGALIRFKWNRTPLPPPAPSPPPRSLLSSVSLGFSQSGVSSVVNSGRHELQPHAADC